MAQTLERAVEASEIVDALKPFGVTQVDVAAVAQVSDRAVRAWRTGDIRADRYDRLAQLLSAGSRFTRDDVRRIILDQHNTEADEVLPWFRGWTGTTPERERARALLSGPAEDGCEPSRCKR